MHNIMKTVIRTLRMTAALAASILMAQQASGTTYDTEMTGLTISGGSLPPGVMIRASGNGRSLGQTTIQPSPGSGFHIDSFFDVYSELSTDNGQTWSPATSGPPHMVLEGDFAANTLPPLDGEYVSLAHWHGYYENGAVITNVIHYDFTETFSPPGPGETLIECFGSILSGWLSLDGGATFTWFWAYGYVCVKITHVPPPLVGGVISRFYTYQTYLSDDFTHTNFWQCSGFLCPTDIVWINDGLPPGSMLVVLDWDQGTADWQWEDRNVQIDPLGTSGPGYDLRYSDYLEFDARVQANVSQPNHNGSYGGIQVIVQGWDGWGDNTNVQGWYALANFSGLSTNWTHYRASTAVWPHVLSRLTLNCYQYDDTNGPTHTEVLIDNVQLTTLSIPPRLQYTPAPRGLHLWSTAAQYARNNIETVQDGSQYYMWAGNGAATYSFTLSAYPTEPQRSNYTFRMYLDPLDSTQYSPDWTDPNIIMMELGTDANGIAQWYFRWKTNAANGNGNLYQDNAQIMITNPTPIGKWTLAFADDTHVSMTSPNGNTTNFVMGVHTNVPDISGLFYCSEADKGTVLLGSYVNTATAGGLEAILTAAQISGLGVTTVSNNWLAETTLNTNLPNAWIPQSASVPWYLVPTNNAMWVRWNLPDAGFLLETNTVQPGLAAAWSTNHGLPAPMYLGDTRRVLIKPGDLPKTKNLFFRLSKPGY